MLGRKIGDSTKFGTVSKRESEMNFGSFGIAHGNILFLKYLPTVV